MGGVEGSVEEGSIVILLVSIAFLLDLRSLHQDYREARRSWKDLTFGTRGVAYRVLRYPDITKAVDIRRIQGYIAFACVVCDRRNFRTTIFCCGHPSGRSLEGTRFLYLL